MLLKTANGGDMQHYGEKEVTFKYNGGESKDPIGLKSSRSLTSVSLCCLSAGWWRRGTKSCWQETTKKSYIMNKATKVKIPVKKKGGAFVIGAHFVKQVFAWQA